MKSYSVKSNAKRFARGIAAKYPEYAPVEPVEIWPGGGEWYPAVNCTAADGFTHPEAVAETCVIDGDFFDAGSGPMGEEGAKRIADPRPAPKVIGLARTEPYADASGLNAMFDAVEPAGAMEVKAHATPEMIERGELIVDVTFPSPVLGVQDTLAAMAASLPPRVESSREEIDRRRAERRARIDAEKAAGARTSSGDKVKRISKKKKILDLIAKPNGATQVELEGATGWQRHTLRGYIAGTLRKILAPVGLIECRKVKADDGEKETRYVFVRHEVKG